MVPLFLLYTFTLKQLYTCIYSVHKLLKHKTVIIWNYGCIVIEMVGAEVIEI
jgi:hypothetical protein